MAISYEKVIDIGTFGSVTAQVYASDGRRVGLAWFDGWSWFLSVEARAKKAHAWADERIRVCLEQECNTQLLFASGHDQPTQREG